MGSVTDLIAMAMSHFINSLFIIFNLFLETKNNNEIVDNMWLTATTSHILSRTARIWQDFPEVTDNRDSVGIEDFFVATINWFIVSVPIC